MKIVFRVLSEDNRTHLGYRYGFNPTCSMYGVQPHLFDLGGEIPGPVSSFLVIQERFPLRSTRVVLLPDHDSFVRLVRTLESWERPRNYGPGVVEKDRQGGVTTLSPNPAGHPTG